MVSSSKRSLYSLFFVCLLGYSAVLSVLAAMSVQSADLYAGWVAAEFLHMGRPDQVYPDITHGFDMTTPPDWWAHVSATDPDARIFPYLYPPLWVALLRPVTEMTTFAALDGIVMGLHQALLVGMIFLASRMCGTRGLTQLAFVALTYTALTLSFPVARALEENQPQIIVSFLIVLAFERAQAGRLRTSGAVLALAAAIKLYPLLFVVIYLGRKQWSAVASFGVAGGLLGLASIALAGWPLHQDYLHLVGALTRSVVVSNMSISLDALVAGTGLSDGLVKVIPDNLEGTNKGWHVIDKSAVWRMASAVATCVALAAVGVLAACRPKDALVLPVAAIALALLSPLSWAYTYLTAFVFLAALPLRLGGVGYAVVVASALFFHRAAPVGLLGTLQYGLTVAWVITIVAMLLLGAAFVCAVLRRPATNAPTRAPAPFLPMQKPF